MKSYIKPISNLVLAMLILLSISAKGQATCNYVFTDNETTPTSKAVKSVNLNNGNLIVAGIREINGSNAMVVDCYAETTCALLYTYVCPDYEEGSEKNIQLIVINDDCIYLNYQGSSNRNILLLNQNLVALQLFQPGKNSYPGAVIATDAAGNLVIARRRFNPSFQKFIQVTKYDKSSFNNPYWFENIYNNNGENNSISDMTCDTLDNCYLTGFYDSNTGKTKQYLAKVNGGGGLEWSQNFDLGSPDLQQTKLIIDAEQRVIMSIKSVENSIPYLNVVSIDPDGTVLWKNRKKQDQLYDGKSFIATDSLCNVYAFTINQHLYSWPSTLIVKYDKTGNMLWRQAVSNFIANAAKVNNEGKIFIAGNSIHNYGNPSYNLPSFKSIDTDGNFIDKEFHLRKVNNAIVATCNGTYNDIAFSDNGAYLVGERHDLNIDGSVKNYYFIDTYTSTAARFVASTSVNSQIKIHPNPASDYLTFDVPNVATAFVTITNYLGETIMQKNISTHQRLDISTLPKGIYLVQLKTIDKTLNQKLIKL